MRPNETARNTALSPRQAAALPYIASGRTLPRALLRSRVRSCRRRGGARGSRLRGNDGWEAGMTGGRGDQARASCSGSRCCMSRWRGISCGRFEAGLQADITRHRTPDTDRILTASRGEMAD